MAVRLCARESGEDVVGVADIVDFIKDNHDGATKRIKFFVENIEKSLLRAASSTNAVSILTITEFVDKRDSNLI